MSARGLTCAVAIAADEYFLLGDNRGLSDDSRFRGAVKRSWILGLVRLAH